MAHMLLIVRTKLNCVKCVLLCEKYYVNINVLKTYLYIVDRILNICKTIFPYLYQQIIHYFN